MNLQEEQAKFMLACGQAVNQYPIAPEKFEALALQVSMQQTLIQEEIAELIRAVDMCYEFRHDKGLYWQMLSEISAEAVDVVYVVIGLCNTLGLNVNAMFSEIHGANMRKVGEDGLVKKRPDGKIMKPEGWEPANKLRVILEARDYKV